MPQRLQRHCLPRPFEHTFPTPHAARKPQQPKEIRLQFRRFTAAIDAVPRRYGHAPHTHRPASATVRPYVLPASAHTPPEDQNAATPSTTLSSPTVRTYLSHSACSPQAAAAKRNPLTISPVYRSDRRRASKVRTRAPYTPPGLRNGTSPRTSGYDTTRNTGRCYDTGPGDEHPGHSATCRPVPGRVLRPPPFRPCGAVRDKNG